MLKVTFVTGSQLLQNVDVVLSGQVTMLPVTGIWQPSLLYARESLAQA